MMRDAKSLRCDWRDPERYRLPNSVACKPLTQTLLCLLSRLTLFRTCPASRQPPPPRCPASPPAPRRDELGLPVRAYALDHHRRLHLLRSPSILLAHLLRPLSPSPRPRGPLPVPVLQVRGRRRRCSARCRAPRQGCEGSRPKRSENAQVFLHRKYR